MRVTIDERLTRLCSDFSVAKIGEWLERKFSSYDTSKADFIRVDENKNDKEYFKSARLLGFVRELPEWADGAAAGTTFREGVNRPLLVSAVEMRKILTERTSRQAQFNFAKRVLQNAVRGGAAGLNGYPSQGLFFFYDSDGFFRISLVTGEMDGRKFKFNEAKRQSFYIDPNRPNHVAKSRLSVPLDTFAKLKEAFSVETLTKEFYGKLFEWYEWAMKPETGVSFPNDDSTPEDDRKYNNESIIRLITRLMFTWFIRQRDMVRKELFDVESVRGLLKSFDPKSMDEDNYYRCVLQNLFFATFNCQPEKRGFIKHKGGSFSCYSDQHNVKTLYRYEKEFKDADAFKALLKRTPFLNCALFDCLDKQEREQDGGRLLLFDGFSDDAKRQAHVPNGLFFHPEKGIIPLFDTYEFTIDENNADDADVALDPELLGKVFENLLGAFNPETQETARKATGSFYTPREIVDYMVEESLKNYLKGKLATDGAAASTTLTNAPREDGRAQSPSAPQLDAWLDDLFDKTAAAEKRELPFDDDVAAKLREALYSCKILDPACGSGAFPMGILHCMVRLFGRLDPSNIDLNKRLIRRYKQETNEPRDLAYTEQEWAERQEQLKVQLAEGQHYPDYARKLYLIENCIYGVDIQPIATQISKLRFFISLLCDQLRENWNEDDVNHGLLSLPNLEAKFVCANTLISLPKTEGELELMSCSKIPQLREKLQKNRHRIFAARTFKQKEKLKARDLEIRDEIRDAVKATLAKPDTDLIEAEEKTIAQLRKDRVQYEAPKMVKHQKPVQDDFFAATQDTLAFEMVDENKPKRDQIDARIDFAQRKIDSELAKSSAANITKIDQLATLVAGWDPYDQNASSSFFDPEWMFNLKDGFDVVIGNPPYVEAKKLKTIVAGLRGNYECYSGTADLSVYFYERGINLSSDGGVLSYICTNKFFVTEYGAVLRDFLSDHGLFRVLNFEQCEVFKDILVSSAITFVCNRNRSIEEIGYLLFHGLSYEQFKREFVERASLLGSYPTHEMIGNAWSFSDVGTLTIKRKIDSGSRPLGEIEGVSIYRGVTTGYNPAFIISSVERDELIRREPKCKCIVKKLLQGRNIRKWHYNESDEYLLQTGYDTNIPQVFPVIYEHLSKFKNELEGRADQGVKWWNLRACKYYGEFDVDEKIVWGLTANKWAYALDEGGHYLPSNGYILTSKKLSTKYILGLLNSSLLHFYFGFIGVMTAGGAYTLKAATIEALPIVLPSNEHLHTTEALVNRILAAKKADPEADTSAWEREIDQLVYKLYGLTEEEIAVVEGREKKVEKAGGGGEGCGEGEGSGARGASALPRRGQGVRRGGRGASALPRREAAEDEEELE